MGNTLGGFIRRAIAMFTLPQSNQAATFPDPVLDAGSHTPIGAASANGHSEATQSREAGGPLTFPGSGEIVTAAEAAKAAYKKHRRRAAEGAMSLSDLMDGFTIVREVDEYIFFQRGTDFYLAIPGTYRIMEDWVACNLQHDLQRPPELFANLPGDVAEWGMHRGFLRRLQEVLAKNNLQGLLEDWVEGWAPPQRLVISGHSLGGAVAAMLTLWLLQLPVMTPDLVSCLACITFGAPLLTTQAAGRRLEEERPMWTNRYDLPHPVIGFQGWSSPIHLPFPSWIHQMDPIA